ncbi:MAG: hypothetical protein M3Q75_12125 [Gemmatimonadota bacterium]|nr:hypothetical protein [Gemmatimonadota bacterium]
MASTVICRAAVNDECDIAEFCSGNSAQCPEDQFKTNSTPCDRDNNLCTADTCLNGACQAGPTKTCPAGQSCVPATGQCACPAGSNICGNVCCSGNQSFCCPAGTAKAGECKPNQQSCT